MENLQNVIMLIFKADMKLNSRLFHLTLSPKDTSYDIESRKMFNRMHNHAHKMIWNKNT